MKMNLMRLLMALNILTRNTTPAKPREGGFDYVFCVILKAGIPNQC